MQQLSAPYAYDYAYIYSRRHIDVAEGWTVYVNGTDAGRSADVEEGDRVEIARVSAYVD